MADMSESDKLMEKSNIKRNGFSSVAAGQQTQQDSFVTWSSSFCRPDDQTVALCYVSSMCCSYDVVGSFSISCHLKCSDSETHSDERTQLYFMPVTQ